MKSPERAVVAYGSAADESAPFRLLVDHVPQLVWTCSVDGLCDFVNEQWRDYTGAPLEAHLGAGWLEHIHPDDRERLARVRGEQVAAATELVTELRIRRHDGQYRWFDTRAAPVRDPEGRITRWVGSSTDVHEAKQAAVAIRDSERYLRLVFEHMTEGVVIARLDGQIIYWNPAGLAMHGYSSLEEVLRGVAEFGQVYELSTLEGRVLDVSEWPIARVFRGEDVREVEVRVRRRDIAWERILTYSGAIVAGPVGPLAFVTIADVTLRKEAVAALEESEERLRLANDAAGIGTFLADLETGIVKLSSSFAELFGLPGRAEVPRELIMERIHPEDLAAMNRQLAALDPKGDARVTMTVRVIHPGGAMRSVVISNRTVFRETATGSIPIRRLGACTDVTELRRAERRLATQNRVSRVLAEAASLSEAMQKLMQALCDSEDWDIGSVWLVDGEAGVLRCAEVWHRPGAALEVVAQLCRSLSFARGAGLPGRVWTLGAPLLVDVRDDPAFPRWPAAMQAGMRKAMAFPITVAGEVTGVIDFLGARGPAPDDRLFDMFGGIGQQLGVFFERKRAQRERELLEAQLRQSQKMDALGQLSGGIAHDFNNILTAIVGNLYLAKESTHPADLAECLGQIEAAGERARLLVRKILTFSRNQPQERSPIALGPVVREAVHLLRASIPAGVRLDLDIAEDAPTVLADPTQIHQLVVNLGTNAWHALEGQAGRIGIDVARVAVDARTAVALGLPRGHVFCRISVSDTGTGMDAATQERIFEPFFTTKEVGRGTGLGLSVVYGIVRSHEGSIRLQSAPGEGSTFRVYLPAMAGSAAASTHVRPEVRPGRGEHVLYVDDEPALAALVQRTMSRRGYRITAHLDPVKAVAAFREDPGQFALVLSDMNMPGMSGVQAAQQILQVRPDIPVLVASGNVTQDLQERCEAIGVRRIVHKPFSPDELAELFWSLLNG